MTINRDNFEAYMLDYLEGNLDPLLTADLMAFIAENPEFENLIADQEHSFLVDYAVLFDQKEKLMKDFSAVRITDKNIDEFCIAACEGLLSPNQLQLLQKYVNENPDSAEILEVYRKIKLNPDLSVTYSGKQNLKKSFPFFSGRRLYAGLAIAASIAFIVMLSYSYTKNLQHKSRSVVNLELQTNHHAASTGNSVPDQVVAKKLKSSPHQGSTIHQKVVTEIAEYRKPDAVDNRMSEKLETLQPKQAEVKPLAIRPPKFKQRSVSSIRNTTPQAPQKRTYGNMDSENLFAMLASKVDIWKTAESAITGFNHLTESQLSLNREMDNKGNTTKLVVNTERYSFTGKMK